MVVTIFLLSNAAFLLFMGIVSSLVGHYTGHLVIMTIMVFMSLIWSMAGDETNIRKIKHESADSFILVKSIIFTGFVASVMHIVYFLILFGILKTITITVLLYAVFLMMVFFISVMIFANRVQTV